MNPLIITPFAHPIRQTVAAPGSKSYTNRALLMAAMTPEPVVITGSLASDDTAAMISCLRTLGIEIQITNDTITVVNDTSNIKDESYMLNADLSGITIRFLLALACVIPGVQTLQGKAGLNKRPVRELVEGLRQLGASIEYLDREGFPPVRVSSSRLKGGDVTMDGGVSSQYFSALLMVAPLIKDTVTVHVSGEQISKPYIDMTIDTMRYFGITATNEAYKRYTVTKGQQYRTTHYAVEGDVSSASYFFAIAALTGSTITVSNLNPSSKQADMQFLQILQKMGNRVHAHKNAITITGMGVKPMTVDMQDCPDQAMTLAVLAAFAPGTTTITGIQSLRVKETERVAALEQELAKMGVQTSSTHDTLTIHGGSPRPVTIDTYGDHRIAMAFSVAGTKLDGMVINNPEVVSKTFPEYWDILSHITPDPTKNIVLIGMRGSGKNTIGALIARRLKRQLVDADEQIVKIAKMTIPEIVAKHGWQHFRDQEARIAQELATTSTSIIATGGGMILRPENVTALKRHGVIILLTGQPATLAKRIAGDPNRPPLTGEMDLLTELKTVWQERQPIYEAAADISVTTDGRAPKEIADEIIKALENNL